MQCIDIYDLISIKQRKNYELIRRLSTVTYQLKILSENDSNLLWAHDEFNMVSKPMGSHLVRPEFENLVRGQLILSPSTGKNYLTYGQVFPSFESGRRISGS